MRDSTLSLRCLLGRGLGLIAPHPAAGTPPSLAVPEASRSRRTVSSLQSRHFAAADQAPVQLSEVRGLSAGMARSQRGATATARNRCGSCPGRVLLAVPHQPPVPPESRCSCRNFLVAEHGHQPQRAERERGEHLRVVRVQIDRRRAPTAIADERTPDEPPRRYRGALPRRPSTARAGRTASRTDAANLSAKCPTHITTSQSLRV